jgi:competence ComEA-like helix-hairpin-helix protein
MGRVIEFGRPSGSPPRRPWWKKVKLTPAMGVATAVLAAGSAGIWFLHDARNLVASSGPAEGSLRVNLNTASLSELESIPGIGESFAQLIVAHRPYTSVDQLVVIRGLGESSVESLRPFVKVDGETEKLR